MTKKRNINLIEILVVVAIIAVLGTISVNKFGSMQTRAKVAKTVTELNSISAAIVSYKNEYGELPYVGADNPSTSYPTADAAVNFSEILPILRGENKRGINFLNKELKSQFQIGDTESYSSHSYQIALDYDHSDTVDSDVFSGKTFPEINEDALTTVAVWVKSPNEGHSDILAWTNLDLNKDNDILASNDPNTPTNIDPDDGLLAPSEVTPSDTLVNAGKKAKSNNGHGNNADGVDSSNPGKSKAGQDTDPTVDDEAGGGNSNTSSGNSNGNGNGNGKGNKK